MLCRQRRPAGDIHSAPNGTATTVTTATAVEVRNAPTDIVDPVTTSWTLDLMRIGVLR
jgi:hypothetical protein